MGEALEPLQDLPVGHRPAAPPVRDGHLLPVCVVAADGCVHSPPVLPEVPHQHGLIGPGQGVVLELGGEGLMGGVVLGRDDEAAGVPVNPVDDPRPQLPSNAAEAAAAVVEQGVNQGAVRVARGRVDHQPSRLVHHNYVLVLIHHIQGDVLGQGLGWLRVRQLRLHQLPALQAAALGGGPSRHRHPAGFDEPRRGGAGQLRDAAGQEAVQPGPPVLTGRRQAGPSHGPSPFLPPCRGAADSRPQSRWSHRPPGCPPR